MTPAAYIRDGRQYAVVEWSDRDRIDVTARPVNPKTGRPWQARKILATFRASERAKALRFWLYAHRRA